MNTRNRQSGARSRTPRRHRLSAALAVAMACSATLPAQAAEVAWNGTQSQSWFNGLNWTPVGPPGPNDDVVINTINPNVTTVDGVAAGSILDLTVGRTGTATLQIINGGSVSNQVGIIGEQAGSLGAVTVGSPGSLWDNAQSLWVGLGGTGALNILAGAQVNSSGDSGLGIEAGSEGTVLVSDAAWDHSGSLSIGERGTGRLFVIAGGEVFNLGGASLGVETGSVAEVRVSGASSSWTASGLVRIGVNGAATLEIIDGGEVSFASAQVGRFEGSEAAVTVSGANSEWNIGNGLVVGSGGRGSLTIMDGGVVTNAGGFSTIGAFSVGTGTVTVTGNGSVWDNADELQVGAAGTGSLVIADGGLVTSSAGGIGLGAPAEGAVTVTGAGALWSLADGLTVAHFGSGTLEIASGGNVAQGSAGFIGRMPGSQGAATVTGAGSGWTIASNLFVGSGGNGALVVSDGAQVSNNQSHVGLLEGSEGSVLVTGAGSVWSNASSVRVAQTGTGTVRVEDGGRLDSAGGVLALQADANAAVTVHGAGSTWQNSAELVVGWSGLGTLDIADGGLVTSLDGTIGFGIASEGTVTVTGAGSAWNHAGALHVGEAGTGTLHIADGGQVVNGGVGNGVIGVETRAIGTVLVTGAGSGWDTGGGALYVGLEGSGSLSIEDGAAVGNGLAIVGAAADSDGRVTLAGGSTWTGSGNIYIGEAGTGILDIHDGSAVTAASFGFIGHGAGSEGTVSLDGNSSLAVAGDLRVGDHGRGRLTIAGSSSVSNANALVGTSPGGEGTVVVTGPGSTWDSGGNLIVGEAGTGALTITDGGMVTNGNAYIAATADSSGAVEVSGDGSLWTNQGILSIGNGGNGSLEILDGGAVANGGGAIANLAGSVGTVRVAGPGATWTMGGQFSIGGSGTGTLDIVDGGLVASNVAVVGHSAGGAGTVTVTGADSAWSATGDIFVAAFAGSSGVLNIGAGAGGGPAAPGTLQTQHVIFGDGDGTLNFNHTADGYAFSPEIFGDGTVNVFDGTTILGANSGGFTGEAFVHGGALVVEGRLGGSLEVLAGGTLSGNGTVGSTHVAGTLAPGTSIGTLTVDGDVTFLPGSVFEVELDLAGNSDLLAVSGTATLGGGAVAALPLDGIAIDVPYTILTAGAGVTGSFDTLLLDSSSAFLAPALDYQPNAVLLALLQSASFASVALTPNQAAAGAGADSLGNGHPVWDAVVVLGEDDARAAFDALSGEIHVSTLGALLDESRHVREATHGRLYRASSRPAGSRGFWIHGFGTRGRADGDGNADRLERSVGGVFVGGDGGFDNGWRVGAALGLHRSSHDADARRSSADVDSTHLAVYAGKRWGASALRLGAANAWHRVDVERRVAFPGHDEQLRADYDASTLQLFAEYGYHVDRGTLAWEPFAGLAWVQVDGDGFDETGGAAALSAAGSKQEGIQALLGVRLSSDFDAGTAGPAMLRGMLGWQHASCDVAPRARFTFPGGNGFTIAGTPIAGNALVVDLGLDFAIGDSTRFGISYAGRFGSDVRENGLRAVFAMDF